MMNGAKAIAKKYNEVSLILRIVVGLVIGAVLALAVPGAGWVGELGSLFVGALKGIAPVLVFVIVASALAQGSSKLDRRFGTVIWLYMLTTFLAAAIASITSFMFPVSVVLADAAQSDVVPQGLGEVLSTLLTNFVANPVSSLMSGNYIGILFWACMFGLAMKNIGSDTTKKFLADTADAVSQVVRWIINLAPFGIMGLVYTNVAGNGLAIFTQYGKLLALLVHTLPGTPFLYQGEELGMTNMAFSSIEEYNDPEAKNRYRQLLLEGVPPEEALRTIQLESQLPERFVLEILEGIRKVTPPEFVVGIRLGAFEPELSDGVAHAKKLEAMGIDFINVSYGFDKEAVREKPQGYPFAEAIYGAERIRAAVQVPVFAVYGIQDGETAEAVLKQTGADMVNIGRGVLVNYNWASDVKAGRDPGKCLYCKTCMWRSDPDQCAGKLLFNRKR